MAGQHCFVLVNLTNSPYLKRVELLEVEGLENCEVITQRQCLLRMWNCPDVTVRTLNTCFPELSELLLFYTTLLYETKQELTSRLSTLGKMNELKLTPQDERESQSESVCHLLNIVPETLELGCLQISNYTFSLQARETNGKQNKHRLSVLMLRDCRNVHLDQLLEVCSQCQQLKEVVVWRTNMVIDQEKVKSARQLPGLQKFTLLGSFGHTSGGRRLSDKKVERNLSRLCPSAKIESVMI